MSRSLFIFVCAAAACALPIGEAAGAITYKDATNPTGVPDITQGINPYCFEAAVSNGLWYFDQARGKTGLVKHSAKDVRTKWPEDTVALVAEVRKYTARSPLGIYHYIYDKRPGDAKLKGRGRVRTRRGIEWRDYYTFPWALNVTSVWAVNDAWVKDKKTQADRYGWIGVQWHVKGEPANKFLPGGHELGIAGYDDAVKELVVTNGWGHHHLQDKTPVSSSYYDRYDFTLYEDKDNARNNRLRITDTDVTGAVMPPEGKEIDYCEVTHAYWLNAAGKARLSAARGKKPFEPTGGGEGEQAVRPAGAGDAGTFAVLADNEEGEFDMHTVDVRLPLVDPSSFSLGCLQNLDVPPDWQVSIWQPNDDPNPMADDPDAYGTIIGEDWIGLRFSTVVNPIWTGESDSFSFELPESLLTDDYIDAPLDLAAWDADFATGEMTLGVPEPAVLPILLVGAALLRRRSPPRRRSPVA